ncbi:unnamed protein product [Effrenium voratum]|uniref:Uncharacterized protein n=1 Tax=Effrenium voratum TaxID=2562239 RepID=A0AA36MUA5_9DINO|nr:unnamed protein product [Effrenium voratum]
MASQQQAETNHVPTSSVPFLCATGTVRDKGFDTCDLRHLRKLKYFFQAAAMNRMGMAEWSEPVVVDMART